VSCLDYIRAVQVGWASELGRVIKSSGVRDMSQAQALNL